VIETVATKTGSAITVGSGITAWFVDHAPEISVFGILVGILIGISGAVFQYRRDRRETELQRKQIQLVNKSLEDQREDI